MSRDQLHKTRPGRNRALCKSGRRTMTIFMQIAPMRSATILWDLADHMTQGYDGALDSPTGRACERFPAVWGFCFRRPRHTSNETPANSRRHRCSARWPRVPACAGWVLLLSRSPREAVWQCGRELSSGAPTMGSRVQTVALSPGLFLPAGRHHLAVRLRPSPNGTPGARRCTAAVMRARNV